MRSHRQLPCRPFLLDAIAQAITLPAYPTAAAIAQAITLPTFPTANAIAQAIEVPVPTAQDIANAVNVTVQVPTADQIANAMFVPNSDRAEVIAKASVKAVKKEIKRNWRDIMYARDQLFEYDRVDVPTAQDIAAEVCRVIEIPTAKTVAEETAKKVADEVKKAVTNLPAATACPTIQQFTDAVKAAVPAAPDGTQITKLILANIRDWIFSRMKKEIYDKVEGLIDRKLNDVNQASLEQPDLETAIAELEALSDQANDVVEQAVLEQRLIVGHRDWSTNEMSGLGLFFVTLAQCVQRRQQPGRVFQASLRIANSVIDRGYNMELDVQAASGFVALCRVVKDANDGVQETEE